jgi:hypothetical protein
VLGEKRGETVSRLGWSYTPFVLGHFGGSMKLLPPSGTKRRRIINWIGAFLLLQIIAGLVIGLANLPTSYNEWITAANLTVLVIYGVIRARMRKAPAATTAE